MDKPTREVLTLRPAPAERSGEPRGKPRLLLVEDDDALRAVLARSLASTFDVTTASDGATAAELLVKGGCDGVLSDIGLPGMSGVDLLRLVRTYDLDVPVVLMTGQPSVETAVAALELGALTYIQKPFSQDELRSTLLRATTLARLAQAKREAVLAGVGGSPLAGDRAGLVTSFERALETMSIVFPTHRRSTRQEDDGLRSADADEGAFDAPPGSDPRGRRAPRAAQEVGRRVRELAAYSFQPPADDMVLFVNVHPADLHDRNLYERTAPLTRMADHVVLEITERAALDDITETKHRATELRHRGYRLAVDDLGAGYAGLTSFATLEPEVVKLDMSLIRGVELSPVKRHIVDSMTRLCRDLDMRVVAEGIETRAELAAIVDVGCDYLQGYLLGRPGPTLALAELVW
jgi:EAL domain-containing protein (putative c-di-GMP-specific phosphodiesterase class I)/DNA-binding response OmpR family regulator